MPTFTRTWWGQRFIAVLEEFTDANRLARGRSYANNGRILSYDIDKGTVRAKVRGSINPYFGVYKEPIYATSAKLKSISSEDWKKVLADLSSRAGFVAKLLLNEMPDTIENAFAPHRLQLLPRDEKDFTTTCSCPDWSRPCKHVAGLCYLLSSLLDEDPFLLFELRGLSGEQLRTELARSPLGKLLVADLQQGETPIEHATSYFTRPTVEPASAEVTLKEFWTGAKRLPAHVESGASPSVPALLIKKQGDFPAFWPKDASFIETMEAVYERIRTKSPALK